MDIDIGVISRVQPHDHIMAFDAGPEGMEKFDNILKTSLDTMSTIPPHSMIVVCYI